MKAVIAIILAMVSLPIPCACYTQKGQSSVASQSIEHWKQHYEPIRGRSIKGSRRLQGPNNNPPPPEHTSKGPTSKDSTSKGSTLQPKDPEAGVVNPPQETGNQTAGSGNTTPPIPPPPKQSTSFLMELLDRIISGIRAWFTGLLNRLSGSNQINGSLPPTTVSTTEPSVSPHDGVTPDEIISGGESTIPVSDSPSMVFSDHPSMTPSDYPSMITSDYPSMIPSDYPSMIPSDYPSMIPSDSPSMVPSDFPSYINWKSVTPSDAPSLSPNAFSLPDGYEACPNYHTTDVAELAQLTVSSEYTFTVLSGIDPLDVSSSIENAIHVFTMEELCSGINDNGPLAISSVTKESDTLATCDEGPCYLAEIQTSALYNSSVDEKKAIYCKIQKTLDAYITSNDFIGQINGVDSIQLYNAAGSTGLNCTEVNFTDGSKGTNTEPSASLQQESSNATALTTGSQIGIGCAAVGVVAMAMMYMYKGSRNRIRARGIAVDTNPTDLGVDEDVLTPQSGHSNMIRDQQSSNNYRRSHLSEL